MAEQLIESLVRRVRAREVPRHLPRAGARPHRAQGGGRERSGRAPAAGRGEGRRPDGRARGSVKAAKEARKRHPTANGRQADDAPEAEEPKASRRRSGPAPASRPDAGPPVASPGACPPTPWSRSTAGSSLSNLDKVLYPEAGFTKAEVIDYYVRIAPVMLPHIARPGHHPAALPERGRRRRRSSRSAARSTAPSGCDAPRARRPQRRHRVLPARRAAALVWAANMAALELHAPMARGRRHRLARPWSCSTSTPARRRRIARVRRGRRCCIRDVLAGIGLELLRRRRRARRACSCTCRSTALHTHEHAVVVRARRRPGARASDRPSSW